MVRGQAIAARLDQAIDVMVPRGRQRIGRRRQVNVPGIMRPLMKVKNAVDTSGANTAQ